MRSLIRPFTLLACGALLVGLVGCDSGGETGVTPSDNELNTAEYLQNTSDFSTLTAAVEAAGASETLTNADEVTVFAPQNAAFDGLEVGALTGDSDLLDKVLNHHVVDEDISFSSIEDGQTVETLAGTELTFSVSEDGTVTVNGGITVASSGVSTTNGRVHPIGGVMLDVATVAERVRVTSSTSGLEAQLRSAELLGALSSADQTFTVFAPSNSALGAIDTTDLNNDADLRARVLGYHVVPGQSLQAGDIGDDFSAQTLEGTPLTFDLLDGLGVVSTANVPASNGTIHVIDRTLLASTNIAQRAALTPATSTLDSLVQEAGLDGSNALGDDDGTFTVFAPTNGALSGLDADRFDGDAALLEKTLTYHVLPNEVPSGDLTDGMSATTLQGDDVQIRLPDSGPMVNTAAIVATDIPTRNGVIHLIDGPLLEASTVGERIDLASKYSVLEQLLRDTNRRGLLDETEGTLPSEAPFTVFAPTNAAFDAIDTSGLSASEVGDLLDYHLVTNAAIMSDDISNGQRVETREGSELFFGVSGGSVTINNDATVTVPDQRSTQNGVVHEIDRVLMPPSGN
jgi:transforming growth factor-beta-induced protein